MLFQLKEAKMWFVIMVWFMQEILEAFTMPGMTKCLWDLVDLLWTWRNVKAMRVQLMALVISLRIINDKIKKA